VVADGEEMVELVVSPVGRTGTTPVAVDDVVVTTKEVEGVVEEDRAMQEDSEAHEKAFPQHPPPIPTGQA